MSLHLDRLSNLRGEQSRGQRRASAFARPLPSISDAPRYAAILAALSGALLVLFASSQSANAQRIENQTAVFAALDKVTARISRLEVNVDETAQFGALKVTPRQCNSRAPTEPPKTTAFVEVQELKLDGSEKQLFSGWMFAQSPGLNAVEHPVFDVWLTDCVGAFAGEAETGTLKKKRRVQVR